MKLPQQNINQSEAGNGDKKLSVELHGYQENNTFYPFLNNVIYHYISLNKKFK